MLKSIVVEELNEIRKFQIRKNVHERLNNLFEDSLNEDDSNLRNEVISLIKNNQWEDKNPKEFRNSLMKSRHSHMLTDYSDGELSKMKLFKLKGFNIGYALKDNEHKPHSEIVAVYNNEPNVRGIGNELMQSAINNGGCYLDHFDSDKLTSLYSNMGFKEYHRDKYDPQYDPEGDFKNKYGELDVVYRKHVNC